MQVEEKKHRVHTHRFWRIYNFFLAQMSFVPKTVPERVDPSLTSTSTLSGEATWLSVFEVLSDLTAMEALALQPKFSRASLVAGIFDEQQSVVEVLVHQYPAAGEVLLEFKRVRGSCTAVHILYSIVVFKLRKHLWPWAPVFSGNGFLSRQLSAPEFERGVLASLEVIPMQDPLEQEKSVAGRCDEQKSALASRKTSARRVQREQLLRSLANLIGEQHVAALRNKGIALIAQSSTICDDPHLLQQLEPLTILHLLESCRDCAVLVGVLSIVEKISASPELAQLARWDPLVRPLQALSKQLFACKTGALEPNEITTVAAISSHYISPHATADYRGAAPFPQSRVQDQPRTTSSFRNSESLIDECIRKCANSLSLLLVSSFCNQFNRISLLSA